MTKFQKTIQFIFGCSFLSKPIKFLHISCKSSKIGIIMINDIVFFYSFMIVTNTANQFNFRIYQMKWKWMETKSQSRTRTQFTMEKLNWLILFQSECLQFGSQSVSRFQKFHIYLIEKNCSEIHFFCFQLKLLNNLESFFYSFLLNSFK